MIQNFKFFPQINLVYGLKHIMWFYKFVFVLFSRRIKFGFLEYARQWKSASRTPHSSTSLMHTCKLCVLCYKNNESDSLNPISMMRLPMANFIRSKTFLNCHFRLLFFSSSKIYKIYAEYFKRFSYGSREYLPVFYNNNNRKHLLPRVTR